MDRKEVMETFNKTPRIGTLSTSNKNGDVNVAIFGSPRMIDEENVVMGIGNNRSFKNLQENPKAAYIVLEPGNSVAEWKGVRVYLKAESIELEGSLIDGIKENIAKMAGKQAADGIHAGIRFKITEVRNLIAPI